MRAAVEDVKVGTMAGGNSAEQALTGGTPQRVGWFRFYFADERWEWSDEVAILHGYEPGTVTPTTELVLSHRHPDDRVEVAGIIDQVRHTDVDERAYSMRHRIVDTRGETHEIVIIADKLLDDAGRTIGTRGFCVDMTPSDTQTKAVISATLAEITENRAVIEQVKGMLMLIYRVDDDTAFELLRWRSQETNVKLRLLAEQLVRDYAQLEYDETLPPRSTFDHLLLTTHLRMERGDDTVKG